MMLVGQAYFYLCALIAVFGAVAVVVNKSPIRGALGLLVMILAIAGLFLALHAQFLAAIQLIVYAGAIVILFLFVIMLLGPTATTPSDTRGRIPRSVGAGLFGVAGLAALGVLIFTGPKAAATVALLPSVPPEFGTVDAFGRILFTQGLLPFELSSALLMVAIVGAVAVARGRTNAEALAAGTHKHHVPTEGLSADDVPQASTEGAPRSPGGTTREENA